MTIPSARTAVRRLRRDIVSSAVVVALLAIGVGTALLAVRLVWGIVHTPLPYPEPHRLVLVTQRAPGADVRLDRVPLSAAGYIHYREHQTSLRAFAAFHEREVSLMTGGIARRVDSARATANLLDVLSTPPALGRWFTVAECSPGAPAVAVISHGLWQRAFAADDEMFDRKLVIDGEPTVVVGVMPAGFAFPRERITIWTPLAIDEAAPDPGNHWLRGIARLEPGATAESAQAELESMLGSLSEAYPEVYSRELLEDWGFGVVVRDLLAESTREIRPSVSIVLIGAALILAVCCLNPALLFAARARRRRSELAVRSSLGAGHMQLACELAVEPLLLGLAGALVGTVAAAVAAAWIATLDLPFNVPRLQAALSSWQSYGFVGSIVGIAFVATALPAVLESFQVSNDPRLRPSPVRRGSLGLGGPVLVAVQIALTVILVFTASLLSRSSRALEGSNLGFETRQVLSFSVSLSESGYPDRAARQAFDRRLTARLSSLTGVSLVATATSPPLSGRRNAMLLFVDDGTGRGLDRAQAIVVRSVSPEYFATVGQPILRGRSSRRWTEGAPVREVVINEAFARRFFAATEPLGHRVSTGDDMWSEIVGLVADTREAATGRELEPVVYLPLDYSDRHLAVVVRADASLSALVDLVREAARELDPSLPLEDLWSFSEALRVARWRAHLLQAILSAGALLALVAAVVGLAGVVSQTVTANLRDLTIRLALGATRVRAATGVLRATLWAAAAGLAGGVVGGLVLGRQLRALLFEVSAVDPTSLLVALAAAALAAVGGVAVALRQFSDRAPFAVLRGD